MSGAGRKDLAARIWETDHMWESGKKFRVRGSGKQPVCGDLGTVQGA